MSGGFKMGTLLEELQKKGLIEKVKGEKIEELKRQEKLRFSASQVRSLTSKRQSADLGKLGTCELIKEFKAIAKDLLIQDADANMAEVVKQAHRFKDVPGGRQLIRMVYQIRTFLPIWREEREKFLKRAFRRAGATLKAAPDEWTDGS